MLPRSRMLVAVLLLSALSSVTVRCHGYLSNDHATGDKEAAIMAVSGQLQIYQARIETGRSTKIWKVEGVATVELDGCCMYVFDCNTTLNNGSGVRWTRLDGSNGLRERPLTNGKRLDAEGLLHQHLGNYLCWDERTAERLILRITDSNPAVIAVNSTVGVIQGNSITLEVYISGYPTIQGTDIHWYHLNPTRQEITSGATFQDSRRRMILHNVQPSDARTYECEAINQRSMHNASARIQLQVYVPPSVHQLQSNNIEVTEWTTSFAISCSATGSPLPIIHWEREGGKALSVDTEESMMTGSNLVTSTLRFTRQGIRYDDQGRYRCVASNAHTTPASSEYTYLTVRPTLLLTAIINGQAQYNFGELLVAPNSSRIRVECFGSGNHYWQTSNDSQVSTSSQDMLYQQKDPSRSAQALHITSFSQDTIGVYTCVTNLTGTLLQQAVFITSYHPAATITYQELTVTSSTPHQLNLTDGDEGPTFVCKASGYFPPTLTWQKDNSGSPLPNQVNSVIDNANVQPIRELRWLRSLRHTDSGSYSCTAENNNGTDTATLNLLVRSPPEINTISAIDPVHSDPSTSTRTFTIPANYTGAALTCSAFAWPSPSVQWLKNDSLLPSGILSEQMPPRSGNVSAMLKWTRPFVSSDMGTYNCLVTWDDTTIQSTVDIVIVQGSIVSSVCSVNTTTIFFQVRVLEAHNEQWDAVRNKHFRNQFQQELFRIVETECNCTLQPDSIQINNPPQCNENATSGVVFRGTIRAKTVAATQEIFCTILDWQQRGSSVNLNENLYHVDSQFVLRVDSFTSQECTVPPNSDHIRTIILIVVSVGGVLLAVIVLLGIVLCCCCIKRRNADVVQQQPKDGPTQAFYGSPAISPSTSATLDNMIASHHFETNVQPHIQPVSSTGSMSMVGCTRVDTNRVASYHTGPVNPLSLTIGDTSENYSPGRQSSGGIVSSYHGNSHHSNRRRVSEGVATSQGTHCLPVLDENRTKEFEEDRRLSHTHGHRYPGNTYSGTPASANSIVKLAPACSLSRDSASEELLPYSSKLPSMRVANTGSGSIAIGRQPTNAGSENIIKGRRPTSTGSSSIANGGQPWYMQSESDFSLNQYPRRANTTMHSGSSGRLPASKHAYAQTHNSKQKPRANGSPRAQAGPYLGPIMHNSTTSVDTFTRVQNSPHFEMVTV